MNHSSGGVFHFYGSGISPGRARARAGANSSGVWQAVERTQLTSPETPAAGQATMIGPKRPCLRAVSSSTCLLNPRRTRLAVGPPDAASSSQACRPTVRGVETNRGLEKNWGRSDRSQGPRNTRSRRRRSRRPLTLPARTPLPALVWRAKRRSLEPPRDDSPQVACGRPSTCRHLGVERLLG